MDNIEILKDFINGKTEIDKLEKYKGGYKLGFFYTKDLQNAIKNLIKENEDLNNENINLKEEKIIDKNKVPEQNNFYDYFTHMPKNIKADICPVCMGRGSVTSGFYESTGLSWTGDTISKVVCRSCFGRGYVTI